MKDTDLVREAQLGIDDAFEELYRRWYSRLKTFCERRGLNHELAEDVAQESMFRAHQSLDALDQPDYFGAWVKGIAARVHWDWQKKRSWSEQSFTSLDPDFDADFDSSPRKYVRKSNSDQAEIIEALRREIDRLSPTHRTAIRLYYSHNLTYRQLAEKLGVSVATVNARLTQAKKTLRQRLSAYGFTEFRKV